MILGQTYIIQDFIPKGKPIPVPEGGIFYRLLITSGVVLSDPILINRVYNEKPELGSTTAIYVRDGRLHTAAFRRRYDGDAYHEISFKFNGVGHIEKVTRIIEQDDERYVYSWYRNWRETYNITSTSYMIEMRYLIKTIPTPRIMRWKRGFLQGEINRILWNFQQRLHSKRFARVIIDIESRRNNVH